LPLADFACLSKKCAKKRGEAPVYELPIKAIACPACGSRKIKRLYNKINILKGARPDHFDTRHTSSSKAQRLDAIIEQPMLNSLAKRDELKAASRYRADGPPGTRWEKDMGIVHAVPTGNIARGLQRALGNDQAPLIPAAPVKKGSIEERRAAARSGHKTGMVAALEGVAPPTIVAARDTEYRVVRGKDGMPEAARG